MIKVDLSNVVPRRLGTYLLGIVPGLFFALSMAFANPGAIHVVIDQAKEVYPLPPYALLLLFFFVTFAVGQTFFLSAWLVEVLLGFIYRLKRFLVRITFGSLWMYRLLGQLQKKGPNRNRFVRLLSWLIFRARMDHRELATRSVLKCWRLAAVRLMALYGFDRDKSDAQLSRPESEAWYSILGKANPQMQESVIVTRTLMACGLALLSALFTSPEIRNRFFVTGAVVFTAAGCYQLFSLTSLQQNSTQMALIRLKWVLRGSLNSARTEKQGRLKTKANLS